ncbi:hypothetical protein K449DRAFT_399486 [Hypoxylon sp. EC38]|nr:hypothetical protein K449DRAFT_399486 [Hypoxylon sp. EC38]
MEERPDPDTSSLYFRRPDKRDTGFLSMWFPFRDVHELSKIHPTTSRTTGRYSSATRTQPRLSSPWYLRGRLRCWLSGPRTSTQECGAPIMSASYATPTDTRSHVGPPRQYLSPTSSQSVVRSARGRDVEPKNGPSKNERAPDHPRSPRG